MNNVIKEQTESINHSRKLISLPNDHPGLAIETFETHSGPYLQLRRKEITVDNTYQILFIKSCNLKL